MVVRGVALVAAGPCVRAGVVGGGECRECRGFGQVPGPAWGFGWGVGCVEEVFAVLRWARGAWWRPLVVRGAGVSGDERVRWMWRTFAGAIMVRVMCVTFALFVRRIWGAGGTVS